MCQEFFRLLNRLAEECNGITLAIAHNGSANSRGAPYDLPWITYRSLYNLDIQQRNYRDTYSSTDGTLWTGFREFPRLYFMDTLRAVGQYLTMQKVKIPSLGLDAIAKEFKVGVTKLGEMTYSELSRLSTTFGSEMGLAIAYCL